MMHLDFKPNILICQVGKEGIYWAAFIKTAREMSSRAFKVIYTQIPSSQLKLTKPILLVWFMIDALSLPLSTGPVSLKQA